MKIRTSTVTDEVMARHFARNGETWEALARLGAGDGAELALRFAYGTAGARADSELAEFLQRETGYEIEIEQEGVAGKTPPMWATRAVLDDWVWKMVVLGHNHGGCVFDGWTATVTTGGNREHVGVPRAQTWQHRIEVTAPRAEVLA